MGVLLYPLWDIQHDLAKEVPGLHEVVSLPSLFQWKGVTHYAVEYTCVDQGHEVGELPTAASTGAHYRKAPGEELSQVQGGQMA